MRILNRKTPLQRFLDSVNDTLDVPDGLRFDLPGGGPGKALKVGLKPIVVVTSAQRKSSHSDRPKKNPTKARPCAN